MRPNWGVEARGRRLDFPDDGFSLGLLRMVREDVDTALREVDCRVAAQATASASNNRCSRAPRFSQRQRICFSCGPTGPTANLHAIFHRK
jgi:hypothetical protein